MQRTYKTLGDYIVPIKTKNSDLKAKELLGINIDKFFMPSVANVVGTDLSKYKVVKKNQFACNRMHVGRDNRIPIALSDRDEPFMVSPAYDVFKIKDTSILHPDYLMMWFSRKEYDRNAWFYTDADVRGGLAWDAFCAMKFPLPSPEKQHEIVAEYNTVKNRIELNNQLIQKLEETAQAIYKQWFVDFEFPVTAESHPELVSGSQTLTYKSAGGNMVWNEELEKEIPEGWEVERIEKFASLKYGKMLDAELFQEKGYPVFSGYGVRGYYNEFMYEEPQILVLCRGVSGTGEVRLSPRFSYITNLSIIVEVIKSDVTKMYLYYFLKNAGLRSLDSGSAQSMITSGDLYNQFVLVPTFALQSDFEKYITSFFLEIEVKEKENSKLVELKDLLLSKLATIEN